MGVQSRYLTSVLLLGSVFCTLTLPVPLHAASSSAPSSSSEIKAPSASGFVSQIWTRKMKGAISDMSISKNGKVVLVATSPDRDIEGSASHYLLSRVNAQGRIDWENVMKSPVKEIDISEDGSLAVVSNYGNELFALDAQGKKIWSTEAMCKPQLMNSVRKVLCYHDDDNDPQVAFEVYDWKGKKLLSFPIQADIMSLKLSHDERNLVMGLADGQVVLIGPDFQTVWQKKLPGEIADVSVSEGSQPKVAVLYHAKKKSEELAILDHTGAILKTVSPTFRAVQVELNPQGTSVFYYGNGGDGQRVGGLSIKETQESWKQGGAYTSDYSYSISVDRNQVYMGYEEVTDSGRTSNLLAIQHDGKVKWKLPFSKEDAAYLYSYRIASGASVIAVGTDDGRLSAYRVK